MALLIFDFLRDSSKSTVSIMNTNFTHGSSQIGGGLYISFKDTFSQDKHMSTYPQAVSIAGSSFVSNHAAIKGGI